jgi:prepilin-type N-terminal cleavage/methylation domain-containing protein
MSRRTHSRAPRRAFTLIEVLIAVLILAIGLLALGSVIPVVVRQQRDAQDAVAGVDVVRGAVDVLRNRKDLNRLTIPNTSTPAGWGVWLKDPQWAVNTKAADRHHWVPVGTNELDSKDGEFSLYVQGSPNEDSDIPVSARLWPMPSSEAARPQFVWDFIGRRLPAFAGDAADRLQLAIFVRRIDLNIRVTPPFSLVQVLTENLEQGGIPNAARRVPVAVSVLNGRPTLNGLGPYARILKLGAQYDSSKPDQIVLVNDTSGGGSPTNPAPAQVGNPLLLALQVGQKLVDNFGNVYTVVGVEPGGVKNAVQVAPPVPPWVPGAGKAADENELRQVVFTAQIPASVEVVTISVQNP